jgi:hypothetical protein
MQRQKTQQNLRRCFGKSDQQQMEEEHGTHEKQRHLKQQEEDVHAMRQTHSKCVLVVKLDQCREEVRLARKCFAMSRQHPLEQPNALQTKNFSSGINENSFEAHSQSAVDTQRRFTHVMDVCIEANKKKIAKQSEN